MISKPDFEKALAEIEKKWLQVLFNEIKKEFFKHPLPSHDHTHHLRVWLFAKELLKALLEAGHETDRTDIEKIIISSFFHDVGMTKSCEPSHGKESRLICERYFQKYSTIDRSILNEILEAIEMHDDKLYMEKKKGINTYTILTIADDLDAYGATGIYRYYEIYMIRGINQEEIPVKVIENIENRFRFLVNIFAFPDVFIRKHEARKQFTVDFFKQFIKKAFSTNHPQAGRPERFLNWLVKNATEHKNGLYFLLDYNMDIPLSDKKTQSFLRTLKEELNLFNYKSLFKNRFNF
jgi:HD superfamily phosphodiesterase